MELWVLIPITAILLLGLYLGRNIVVRRTLYCPHQGENADVAVLRRSLKPDKLVRIRSCDLLPDPENVDCDQACLKPGATAKA